jgi:lipopolysaccharide/colanic/teichoic acid biosynthesis glycosyltransferase
MSEEVRRRSSIVRREKLGSLQTADGSASGFHPNSGRHLAIKPARKPTESRGVDAADRGRAVHAHFDHRSSRQVKASNDHLALLTTSSLRSHRIKLVLDVLFAVVLLIVVAPVMVLIALAIKLDSPGPVLFRQTRIGGRRRRTPAGVECGPGEFRIFKFRTMHAHVDDSMHAEHVRRFVAGAPPSGDEGAGFKLCHDPRVTSVGRFLRRTSLDELPQLFNVVMGQISLVGPRPVPLYEVEAYAPEHLRRFQVPGGMTGLWQVSGRADLSFEEMIRLDALYVASRSVPLDLKILLLTVPAVLRQRGAA